MRFTLFIRRIESYLASGVVAVVLVYAARAEAVDERPTSEIDVGGIYYSVDEGFADTRGGYLRGRLAPPGRDEWRGELAYFDRFDDTGVYAAAANRHEFGSRWFTDVGLATSSGGFFLPELRVDGAVSYRWLAGRNLVTSAGITYFDAKDIHSDTGFRLEAIWYSASPWIVQGGAGYNISEPGAVGSATGYVAVSHAVNGKRIVTARVGGGEQAYQPFADDRFQVGIAFGSARLSVRQWLGRAWGINVVADTYFSDTYDQHGVEVGLFREF